MGKSIYEHAALFFLFNLFFSFFLSRSFHRHLIQFSLLFRLFWIVLFFFGSVQFFSIVVVCIFFFCFSFLCLSFLFWIIMHNSKQSNIITNTCSHMWYGHNSCEVLQNALKRSLWTEISVIVCQILWHVFIFLLLLLHLGRRFVNSVALILKKVEKNKIPERFRLDFISQCRTLSFHYIRFILGFFSSLFVLLLLLLLSLFYRTKIVFFLFILCHGNRCFFPLFIATRITLANIHSRRMRTHTSIQCRSKKLCVFFKSGNLTFILKNHSRYT